MNDRYLNNLGSFISSQDQNIFLDKIITIFGMGGNGGYIAEYLTRLGVKKLIIFDGDNFEESNLNRQLFCNLFTLNQNKAIAAYHTLYNINPTVEIQYYTNMFNAKIHLNYIIESDIIIDCADNLLYEDLQDILNTNIPFLFASNTKEGSIITIFTKNQRKFFEIEINKVKLKNTNIITQISQPAFLCSLTASLSCAELIKFFMNKPCAIGYYLKYDFYTGEVYKEYF